MSLAIGVIRKQVTPVYDYGSGKLSLQQSLGAGGKKGGATYPITYPKRYSRASRALSAAGKGLGLFGGLYTGLEALSGGQQSGRGLGQTALSSVAAGTAVGRGISGAVGRQADKLESGFRAKREPEAMLAHYANMPRYAQEAYQNILQSFPYQQKLKQGEADIRNDENLDLEQQEEKIAEFRRQLQQDAWHGTKDKEGAVQLAQGMPVVYPYQGKDTAGMQAQRVPIIQQQQFAEQALGAGPDQTQFYNWVDQKRMRGVPLHLQPPVVQAWNVLLQQQSPPVGPHTGTEAHDLSRDNVEMGQ